jgi:hypothetical protein
MLRRLLQHTLRHQYPAAGLFVMLLVLWFFLVLAVLGRWATATASIFILHSNGTTDLEIINQHWPHRLIQPQWLDEKYGELDLLFHWSTMELLARLGFCLLVTILLAALSLQLVKRLITHLSQRSTVPHL